MQHRSVAEIAVLYPLALALALWPLLTTSQTTLAARHNPAVSPVLVRAVPASGTILKVTPAAVSLVFATPLDPHRCSMLVVSDSMGLVNGAVTRTDGGRELRSSIRGPLRPGPYAVVWTAATPGGAPVSRSYLFVVGPVEPPLLPNRRVALTRRVGDLTIGLAAPSDRVAHQTYTVTLTAAGRPVEGAHVSLVGRSLDMEMGEVPATARSVGAGRYVAVADVVMAGDWQVAVTVQRRHSTAKASFTYQAHY